MRHIIFGGDGFVGRHLAPMIAADGHEVVVADIVKSPVVAMFSITEFRVEVRLTLGKTVSSSSITTVALDAEPTR